MNIFTRLALGMDKTSADSFMTGGDTPWISGPNDLRPVDPAAPPVSLKEDLQGPYSDLVMQAHLDGKQGQLVRAFDNYLPSVGDWNKTIGNLMSANIERISGSTAASQALARHRG